MYFPYLDTEKNNWISGTGLLVQANILSMNSSCYRLTARVRCKPQILLWNTKWFDQFGFFWTPTATHCNSLTATPIRLALDSVRPTGSQTQCRALLCGSFGPTLYLQCILTKPGATYYYQFICRTMTHVVRSSNKLSHVILTHIYTSCLLSSWTSGSL